MKNTILVDFIVELFNRLSTKSPKFFKIITVISTILGLISGLPYLVEYFGIHLSPTLMAYENKAVAFSAMTAIIMSNLSSQRTQVAVTQDGTVLTAINSKSMPFTAKNEAKQASIKELEVVTEPSTLPKQST